MFEEPKTIRAVLNTCTYCEEVTGDMPAGEYEVELRIESVNNPRHPGIGPWLPYPILCFRRLQRLTDCNDLRDKRITETDVRLTSAVEWIRARHLVFITYGEGTADQAAEDFLYEKLQELGRRLLMLRVTDGGNPQISIDTANEATEEA